MRLNCSRRRKVESEGRAGYRGQQKTNQTGPFGAAGLLLRALRSWRNFEQGSNMVKLS